MFNFFVLRQSRNQRKKQKGAGSTEESRLVFFLRSTNVLSFLLH